MRGGGGSKLRGGSGEGGRGRGRKRRANCDFFPSRPAQPNPVVVLGERNKIPFRDLYGENREGVGGKKGRKIRGTERRLGGEGLFPSRCLARAQKEEKSVTNPFTFGNFLAKKEKIRFLPSFLFLFPLFLLPSSPCAKMCTREEKEEDVVVRFHAKGERK